MLGDAYQRRSKRERDEIRRAEQDRDLAERMAKSILESFPGCPPEEAQAIAAHTSVCGSGRVGRTAAGRSLEQDALRGAVIASIRHRHTGYDRLLMNGVSRMEARAAVRDKIDHLLDRWRGVPSR